MTTPSSHATYTLSGVLASSTRIDELNARCCMLETTPSTNQYLLDSLDQANPQQQALSTPHVVFTQQQTAGRGRQGKSWVSDKPGQQLIVSLLWPWSSPVIPSALSLSVACSVASWLDSSVLPSGAQLSIKWPNDLLINNDKCAGILLESVTTASGELAVVIGVGVNCLALSDAALRAIDQPVTSLQNHCAQLPEHNVLMAGLIDAMLGACAISQAQGFKASLSDWDRFDHLVGRFVRVQQPNSHYEGVADGIDQSGALRILTQEGVRLEHSGTVRLVDPLALNQ